MPAELGDLVSRLGFTMEELNLNRAGELSASQTWSLLRTASVGIGMMLLSLGLVLMAWPGKATTGSRVYYVLLVIALGGTFCFGGWQFVASMRRRVSTADGLAEVKTGARSSLRLVVGKADVDAPVGAKDTLLPGKTYRMYYLATLARFLSIEPL
jgi:hypothetical protein